MLRDAKPNIYSQSSSSSGLAARLKKIPDAEAIRSIQMAVGRTVAALELEPERDLLIQDFMTFESLSLQTKSFTDEVLDLGSEFKFFNYAPIAFKYFRRLFQIKTKNFLHSMCSEPLRQLECSGCSGSAFYVTHDDAYILKTAQQREGDFMLKLLPGYYLNLTQNPRTLLPKFFGYYCYGGLGKSYRLVVMNNLVPSNVAIAQKYDLKGSTTKRKATPTELKKPFPTFKDLDFTEHHPEGLLVEPDTYAKFSKALQRDCRVLESFKIIDYSLLLAVHYVNRNGPNPKELSAGIPAWTASGEQLVLFVGIIDILQSYHFRKKIEHTFKSIIYEKDSISVHRPDFYSRRFQNFLTQTVFRSMSKRKPAFHYQSELQPCCSGNKLIQDNSSFFSWTFGKAERKNKHSGPLRDRENVKKGSLKRDLRITKISEKIEEEGKNEYIGKEKTKPEVIKEKEINEELKLTNVVMI